MIRLAISVEGQTEEAFVKRVLAPHLGSCDVYIYPILVGSRGGGVSLKRIASDMVLLYRSFDYVTSLVDFYRFSGKGSRTVAELEDSIATTIGERVHTNWDASRIIPYVQKHEFEALFFSDVQSFSILVGVTLKTIERLQEISDGFDTPEEIDDGPETAPSERIKALIPGYGKVADGSDLAEKTGLAAIREACPRFNLWLKRLESVREVYVFKHIFLSMRRIDAKSRKARAVLVRFSKSLASRRHLPSQANVLSTTHRLGMTSKPTAVSDRLTISVSKWGKIFFRAWSNTGPWYPPSAKSFFRNGNLPNKVPRTRTPPSRSWILAGCTMACTNRPTVSTRMWRFLPLIFLPAS